jgi:hypothetical protein
MLTQFEKSKKLRAKLFLKEIEDEKLRFQEERGPTFTPAFSLSPFACFDLY